MRRGDLFRYEPVIARAGQSTTRLVITANAILDQPDLPTVYVMHVVDHDPGWLLAVAVEPFGWALTLEIDRVPRKRLVEHLGTATEAQLEQVDNALRATFDL